VARVLEITNASQQEKRAWKRVLVCVTEGRISGVMIGYKRKPFYVQSGLSALAVVLPLLRRIRSRIPAEDMAMTDARTFVDPEYLRTGVSLALLRYARGARD
jgi:hypothetical protein